MVTGRVEQTGNSWFVVSLAYAFAVHSHHSHLSDLLMLVEKVIHELDSRKNGAHQLKTCVLEKAYTLHRSVFFKP